MIVCVFAAIVEFDKGKQNGEKIAMTREREMIAMCEWISMNLKKGNSFIRQ